MSSPDVSDGRLTAGKVYISALKKLGLKPEAVMWVRIPGEEGAHLWVVWSGIDYVGPLALTSLLFDAYNASALPKEISPFDVSILSPNQPIASALVQISATMNNGDIADRWYRISPSGKNVDDGEALTVHSSWIYSSSERNKSRKLALREWKTFQGNVSQLAA